MIPKKMYKTLRTGISAVRSLMDESRGVDGLHLNGDVASWDSLERGGFYEAWLSAFNDAEDAIEEYTPAWSAEPPTEEGWYWCNHNEWVEAVMVYVTENLVTLGSDEFGLDLFAGCRWYGPLRPPEE